jgi:hypothetical protein
LADAKFQANELRAQAGAAKARAEELRRSASLADATVATLQAMINAAEELRTRCPRVFSRDARWPSSRPAACLSVQAQQ